MDKFAKDQWKYAVSRLASLVAGLMCLRCELPIYYVSDFSAPDVPDLSAPDGRVLSELT